MYETSKLRRFPSGSRVAIYNRVSTEKLTQLEAIAHQVEESRNLILDSPFCLVCQYVETESATSTKKREEYKRMLQDMKEDKFDILVVKSQDRMMRSQAEWHLLKQSLRKYHKYLYFYMEDEIFDSRENGMKHDVQAMLDEYESEKKSEKAIHSHKRRQMTYEGQKCLNITRPVFGWDRHVVLDEHGHKQISFTINEKEAQAIRQVCVMIEEGYGFYTIAGKMYEKGILSKPTFGTNPQPPKRMDGNTWKKIIHSSLLHGCATFNTVSTDFYTKEKRKNPQSEWIMRDGAIPAIISKEYHMHILSVLEKRRKEKRNMKASIQAECYTNEEGSLNKMNGLGRIERTNRTGGLFTGKILCKKCGCHYYGRSYKRKSGEVLRTYRCGNSFRGSPCTSPSFSERILYEALENKFRETYKSFYQKQKTNLMQMLKDFINKEEKKSEKQLKLLKTEGNLRLQRLLELYLEDVISKEEYLKGRERIEKETKGMLCNGKKEKTKTQRINEEEILSEIEKGNYLDKIITVAMIRLIDTIEVGENAEIWIHFRDCGEKKAGFREE